MKRNLKHAILCIMFLVIGITLGISTLSTPNVYNGSDTTRFSAINAANHLKIIAKNPHSIVDLDLQLKVTTDLHIKLTI